MSTDTTKDFFLVLLDDLMEEMKIMLPSRNDGVLPSSQIQRRSLIRSGFAAIEGFISSMKSALLEDISLNPGLETVGELAMLREETYSVNRDGRIVVNPRYIPTDANLRFTIAILCRGTGKEEIDVQDHGWAKFKESLTVRNRLTHPRRLEDLDVTDHEIHAFTEAITWFSRMAGAKIGVALNENSAIPDPSSSDCVTSSLKEGEV